MYFGTVKNSHLLYKIIDLALILDNALFFFLKLDKIHNAFSDSNLSQALGKRLDTCCKIYSC